MTNESLAIQGPDRLVYLGCGPGLEGDLDHVVAERIIKALHILDQESHQPIRLLMNSLGGEVGHGLAIYDYIRSLTAPVHIEVYGHCHSIAAWILQAGTQRSLSPSSSVMIHNGEQTLTGHDKKSAHNWARYYRELDHYCNEILLARIRERNPDYTMPRLRTRLAVDTILWPAQAIELGLADYII